jgi:NDP-sugar pyrophosphorylase family protein
MFKAQVVILAGGQGSRLRPYTTILPKPLMPVGEVPILEILIRQLKHYGFKNILISTGYLAQLIEAYFGDGKRWGVSIRYVRESRPLGTAGALKLVGQTENDFLVLNGDIFTDMDFARFFKWHKQQKAMASIAIKERRIKNDFGVIEFGKNHELMAYHEKPEHSSFVSMGINAFNVKAKTFIKKDECLGIPDLMLLLKKASQKISCYQVKDQWLDLGRPEDLERAQEIFEQNKKKFIMT